MKNKNNSLFSGGLHRSHTWLAIAALALPGMASGAPWELSINAEAGVIHTNNLLLAPAGAEENDTVYTVSPMFSLTTDGDRTQAKLLYSPEAYYYSEFENADDVFHVLDANLTTALIRERLFLNLSGIHYQSIVTPDAAIPTSNIPVTGNRVDSTALEIRPYWQQKIAKADLRVEAGYLDLQYDGDQYQASTQKHGSLNINNFKQQEGLAWGLDYNYRRMEYEIAAPFEFQRASLNLGFWVSGSLRLFAVGGAETSFNNIFESNLDEDFWEAGFQFKPNQRFGLEVAAGDRSYGTSLRADMTYTLRRGSLSFNYSEAPSTRAESAFGSRPLIDTDMLDNILDRPGESDRFVSKRGEFRASVDLAKSTLTWRIFSEKRESRTTDVGVPITDEEFSGTAVRWDWRFGPKTTLNTGADIARRDDGVNVDDVTRFNLGVDYRMSAKTSLRIEGHRSKQDRQAVGLGSYTENQGRLLLLVEIM